MAQQPFSSADLERRRAAFPAPRLADRRGRLLFYIVGLFIKR